MATLISVSNTSGEARRCDAKCYGATGPICDCVCGGMNHGAGIRVAFDNTRDLATNQIRDIAGADHQTSKVKKANGIQLLFDLITTKDVTNE